MRILGTLFGLGIVVAFGAVTGAIIGLAILIAGMTFWPAATAGHAGGEDLAFAVAIGCGGLCGAAVSLAVVLTIAFGPSQTEH